MSTDKKLTQLIINKLTKEQFDSATVSPDEQYFITDDDYFATKNDLATKQNTISDLTTIRSNASTGAGLAPQVAVNTQRIEDLTTARIPDVIYHGTPKITGGQVTNFSTVNYLQFPFEDISRSLPFDIYFSFTTDADVTTQQNIIDSRFGIALAIQNGKGVMALSSNGTNWDIGSSTGTNTLLGNTTYYVKYSWTGSEYNASLSTNDQTYVPDMILQSNKSPYKTTIYIGGCDQEKTGHTPHPFKGIINFNKSKVVVNGLTVWEGMADVGLASRANVSLNNLDDVGEARFNAKQDVITDLATIRDGASKGATALQSFTETDPTVPSYVKSITQANITDWNNKSTFSGDYNDLTNKPTIPSISGLAKTDNSLDITASARLHSIVTTTGISKAQNGYVKLGNGIIIQWGSLSISTSTKATWTLTFPTSFSNTNYQIAFGVNNNGSYTEKMPAIKAKTNTGINGQTQYTGSSGGTCIAMWIAVGY